MRPQRQRQPVRAVVVQHPARHGIAGLRADVVDILAELVAVDKQLHAVRHRRRRAVAKHKRHGHVPPARHVQRERRAEEARARAAEARVRTALFPRRARRAREVPALALRVQRALVARAAAAVDVRLAAEVAGQFPGDGAVGVAGGQGVVQQAARRLHLVGADLAGLFHAHVVDEHGQGVGAAGLQRRQRIGHVGVVLRADARERAHERAVQPHRVPERPAALRVERQVGAGARRDEVAPVQQRACVVAVVGAVERGRCRERPHGVVGVVQRRGRPQRVVVAGLDLGEAVDVAPIQGR